MASVPEMDSGSNPKTSTTRRTRAGGDDGWIRSQLKRVYDETLREEIPAEMMDLLRQLDEAAPVDEGTGLDAAEDRGGRRDEARPEGEA